MTAPVQVRVPRAPAVFVGREAELSRVVERLDRGGVAIVTGVGGLGKTALACRAVEVVGATSTAVFVGLRPGSDVALETGRALSTAEGFTTADWTVFSEDPQSMVDAVLDLAEAASRVVVIDDLHAAAAGADEVLMRIARLCRSSRWIVTSRRAPGWPGSEEVVVPLAPLAHADVEQLLESCAPHVPSEERRAIASASGGSPWRARARLRGSSEGDALIAGLDRREVALLSLLAAVTVPVPSAPLLDSASADERSLDLLRRHGLVDLDAGRVRLHDVARAHLEGAALPTGDLAEQRRLAHALATCPDGELAIAGVVLARSCGVGADELAGYAARVEAWIEEGLAERAFVALEGLDDERLVGARLACAAALSTDAALDWAARIAMPNALEPKLWWAAAHERAGRGTLAAGAAGEVRRAAADPDLAARAALIEAEALRISGWVEEAERVLSAARPLDPGLRLLVEARHARTLSLLGHVEEALSRGRAIVEAASLLGTTRRVEVVTTVQTLFAFLGRLAETRAIARRIASDRSHAPFVSRGQIARRCVEAIESGELADGRRWLDRMGSTEGTRLHVHALLNEVRWRAAVGRFQGIEALLDELRELCESSANTEDLAWARIADAYCGVALGLVRDAPWPADLPRPRPALIGAHQGCVRIARRRAGEHPHVKRESCPIIDLDLLLRRDACEGHLLAGELEPARRELAGAIDLARRHGFALHEADLLGLGADLHLAVSGGSRMAARRFASDLGKLARRMGSARFEAEAELADAVASGRPGPDRLRHFSESPDVSPMASRRARALLGEATRLDDLDRRVIGLEPRPLLGEVEPPSSWRFDASIRRAHLPGGRIVDLGRHGLLVRLLAAIQRSGVDGATKERLAREVWEVRDYHPLRDDKRLQVAVRRLRLLLEDDAERPCRLVTTDSGYELRQLERGPSNRE